MGIMVGAQFIRAAFWDCLRAIHHEGSARGAINFRVFANLPRWSRLDCIFAVWVAGTAIKNTKATFAFGHESFFAHWAGDARMVQECSLLILFNKFAFWVISAGDEATKATITFKEI